MKIRIILCSALLCLAALSASAQNTFEHPWAGKKVAYLGDSITDARNRESATKYWGYLEQWLGITSYCYGQNGRQWIQLMGQIERLQAEHGNDVDAIMIFMGTNDFNSAIPVGEWFKEEKGMVNADGHVVERTRRVTNFDTDTYKGRINYVLDTLKKIYPTKQIVMLTPIHRSRASWGQWNVQPTEDWQNGCGEYLDAYVNALKEASNIWSVPVIDTHALSGLFPMHEEQKNYFFSDTDRLHPNDEGQMRLALCLYYQLAALPCRMEAPVTK